ncbi:MAG: inositol monophosphatase family protein [Candidatus Methanomethylicia archaeon]
MSLENFLENLAIKVRVKALELLGAWRIKNNIISEDVGSKIDLELEEMIINEIKEAYKDFTFIGEETGKHVHGSGKPIFIVDPLDGSTNAYRGYPIYSTSIAIATENNTEKIIGGVVMNIITGDTFKALKDQGAKLNNKTIKPSKTRKINEALIAIDLNIRGKYHNHLKRTLPIISEAKHIRFIGTDALETCFVAAGICDAFIDLRGVLRLTDFAAACFIVKEAGGIILNENGENLKLEFNNNTTAKYIAVSNSELAKEIINRLA